MKDQLYSCNLFYSKLDFKTNIEFINIKKFREKILLTHLFYMSFPNENLFNINFFEMDMFLKKNNALTYVVSISKKNRVQKYILKKEINIKEFFGGVRISKKIKNNFLNSTKKIKIYDNHSKLHGNNTPIIPINELTFCVILNYLCSSPPVFLQNKKIRNLLDEIFEIFMKNKNRTRKQYLKLNLKYKKKFEKEFEKIKKKNFSIEKQILLDSNNILKSKYLQQISFIYDMVTKIKPYIFIFEKKLFITIKGTQTFVQVKQDFMSLKMEKIADIIKKFIIKYEPNQEYIELLTDLCDYYGTYKYGVGFFEPVLYILHVVLQQLDLFKNDFNEIYIVGHSLGGAQSTILGILFLHIRNMKKYLKIFENKIIKVVTFGEPSGISKELVIKVQKDMNNMFKYTRVVSFFEENGKTYKDIIVTGNPINSLYIDNILQKKL